MGKKCVKKVMMVEETEYEEVLSYDNRCHTSYVTKYEPHQEEECEEKFKKTCYIDYEKKAYSETVKVCTTPWVKNCTGTGEKICEVVWDSECWTKQTVHEVTDDIPECETVEEEKCEEVAEGYTTRLKCDKWPHEKCTIKRQSVRKYTPDTSCGKVSKQVCGPPGCALVEGPVECRDKMQTVIVDNPVEECDMEPIKTCKHVTKLVPRLVASLECVDVPKEICARSKIRPRRVQKPAIQKWCYNATDTVEKPIETNDQEPGKVLLGSVTIKTSECNSCSVDSLSLMLVGGDDAAVGEPECESVLSKQSFSKGEYSRWYNDTATLLHPNILTPNTLSNQPSNTRPNCFKAALNAELAGGYLLKAGRGSEGWIPESVCVDWFEDTNFPWECKVNPVADFAGKHKFDINSCTKIRDHGRYCRQS